jgi:LPXTG-motif cell wall-anchored protein
METDKEVNTIVTNVLINSGGVTALSIEGPVTAYRLPGSSYIVVGVIVLAGVILYVFLRRRKSN